MHARAHTHTHTHTHTHIRTLLIIIVIIIMIIFYEVVLFLVTNSRVQTLPKDFTPRTRQSATSSQAISRLSELCS